ncbi:hypothetical protein PCANB_001050 [Pneumocystis canis]|nr:hypothetical protein PCANB_001050 [Pneumocystis canis]
MFNNSDCDCIIVGAGVLGTSLAIVLGRQQQRDLSEPNRIVGELLQPGGVKALYTLKLQDVLENIETIKVYGYHIIMGNEQLRIPYEQEGLKYCGRSFHHGQFIQGLRNKAKKEPYIRIIEATVIDIIENITTGHILGVATRLKETGLLKHYFAPLIVIADGCFSSFRKQFITKSVTTKSNFVGLLLENMILPMPLHGHVILSKHSPILIYQISSQYTRILVDIPGKLPSNKTGELKKYLQEVVAPILPKSIQFSFMKALENQRIRSMPNCFLPSSLNKRPGLIILGDAMNMRHPLTGGGMTVALNDVCLLSELLSPTIVPSFHDTDLVLHQMFLFHWRRKKLSSVINILAQSLYFLFSPTDTYMNILQKGCFKYFQLGGTAVDSPIGLLSGFIVLQYFSFITHYS